MCTILASLINTLPAFSIKMTSINSVLRMQNMDTVSKHPHKKKKKKSPLLPDNLKLFQNFRNYTIIFNNNITKWNAEMPDGMAWYHNILCMDLKWYYYSGKVTSYAIYLKKVLLKPLGASTPAITRRQ